MSFIDKRLRVLFARIINKVDEFGLLYIVDKVLSIITPLCAIIFMVGLVYAFGFSLTQDKIESVAVFVDVIWWVFFLNVAYRLSVGGKKQFEKHKVMSWIVGGLFVLSFFSKLFGNSDSSSIISMFWQTIASNIFLIPLLCFYSFTTISNTLVGLISKKTTPALLLSVSFFVIIIIGALLLLLPRSTYADISIIDAIFVATSAVCVTGLTPVDVSTVFTMEGQLIIAALIQIGGLGVMTLTSFFALFFMGNTGLYNHLALRDMVSSESLGSLLSTLIYILGFTLVIESIGMLLIWMNIHGTMDMTLFEELFFAGFHSVSAFCNAGFSTLPGNLGDEAIMGRHTSIYLVISGLIILGGIGFPLLVNFKEMISYQLKRQWKRFVNPDYGFISIPHIANINSRIVLHTTIALLIFGTASFAILEWNGAFADMTTYEKLVHSFFNAVSPRTAGFNSVSVSSFSIQTLLIYMFLMWIGGAAQSTAGGVKVNVFYVAIKNLASVFRGTQRVEIFGREISDNSIRRANATVFISIIVIGLAVFLLTILEPNIPVLNLIFESISAIGTVGSTLDTTPLLGDGGKLMIIALMFIGRIGVLIIFLSFVAPQKNRKYRYPQGHIIIN